MVSGSGPSRMFQSAPLAEARGDPRCRVPLAGREPGFNPLPLPKQGEIALDTETTSVSAAFQSAPLAEARGDSRPERVVVHGREPSFNPLPLPKQGEIAATRKLASHSTSSIRSPCRSKGRDIRTLASPPAR